MKLDKQKYNNFKLRVVSKTNGANVHRVYSYLHKILNCIDDMNFVGNTNNESLKILINKAFEDLNKELKTTFSLKEILE